MSDEKWLKREVFDVVGKITPAASPFSNPPITRSQDVNSFRSGTYYMTIAKEPMTLYRLFGGESQKDGCFWMLEQPSVVGSGNKQIQQDLAILNNFGNTRNELATLTIPAGTVVYQYYASQQSDSRDPNPKRFMRQELLGGGWQLFIPKQVVTAALNCEKTNDYTSMFNAQKRFLSDFETHNNVNLSDKCTSLYNSSNQQVLQNAPFPSVKLQTYTSSLFSGGGGGGINSTASVNFVRASPSERSARTASQQAWQLNFCSSTGISPSQSNVSALWPGGVELLYPINIKMDNPHQGSNEIMKVSRLLYKNSTIYVYFHDDSNCILELPEKITKDEFDCLWYSCVETTKMGLSLSLRLLYDHIQVTTNGIDDVAGAELVQNIMYAADILLCDLIYGQNQITNEKTMTKVQTYNNPYDVEIQLLENPNSDSINFFYEKLELGYYQALAITFHNIFAKYSEILLC